VRQHVVVSLDRDTTIVVVVLAAVGILAIVRGVINQETILLLVVVIPSIILHEVSHGVVALWFGDDTAKQAGRLTLNPIKHIDPFGTVILPLLLTLGGLGAFGYAKPVPVNLSRLRHPRNEGLLVSLAGPATNIALAGLSLIWLRFVQRPIFLSAVSGPLSVRVVVLFGYVNVLLAVFNLLPIPPLDGSAMVERALPRSWWPGWLKFRQYSMPILIVIVLVKPGALARVFTPAIDLWIRLLRA
jgi:Zn-dependent protease